MRLFLLVFAIVCFVQVSIGILKLIEKLIGIWTDAEHHAPRTENLNAVTTVAKDLIGFVFHRYP